MTLFMHRDGMESHDSNRSTSHGCNWESKEGVGINIGVEYEPLSHTVSVDYLPTDPSDSAK